LKRWKTFDRSLGEYYQALQTVSFPQPLSLSQTRQNIPDCCEISCRFDPGPYGLHPAIPDLTGFAVSGMAVALSPGKRIAKPSQETQP
jgi:hypothetical protein